jgi:hypothetical protein
MEAVFAPPNKAISDAERLYRSVKLTLTRRSASTRFGTAITGQ